VADSADLLLHPVRLRIVQAFLGGRPLTTAQLSSELSDIPPASLYRHVARLVRAGVLQVMSERKVRGALERTYTLRLPAAAAEPDESATMTAEDQRQAFMTFTAGLLGDLGRYLAGGDADLLREREGYSIAGLWLDDAELAGLLGDLTRVLQPRMANAPGDGRRRRVFAYALLAADKTA
jgi:hypothetical protein